MYNFILNQWIMRRYDETNITNCVTKKFINQAQADIILATPQIEIITTAAAEITTVTE